MNGVASCFGIPRNTVGSSRIGGAEVIAVNLKLHIANAATGVGSRSCNGLCTTHRGVIGWSSDLDAGRTRRSGKAIRTTGGCAIPYITTIAGPENNRGVGKCYISGTRAYQSVKVYFGD